MANINKIKLLLTKCLTPNFSISGRQNFPKLSRKVDCLIVYRSGNFNKNLSTEKVSESNFIKFGWEPSLPRCWQISKSFTVGR